MLVVAKIRLWDTTKSANSLRLLRFDEKNMRNIVGGIEGGGTRSNVTLIDADTSEVLVNVSIELPTNL